MSLVRNQKEIQLKIQAEMDKAGFDALVLTTAESIFYATGFASRSLYNNGVVGGTIAVVPKTGSCAVICSQFESKSVTDECPDVDVVTYPIWLYIEDFPDEGEKETQPDPNRSFKLAVGVISDKLGDVKKVGVEPGTLTFPRYEYLTSVYGKEALADCGKVIINARAFKTAFEIETLRTNTQMAEKQMKLTADQIKVGMTEEDIMHFFCVNGFNLSKEVYGIRQAHTYSEYFSTTSIPRTHKLINGDIVRLDGGVMRKGYSSDLGRTFVVGDTLAPERKEIYDLLLAAYDTGLSMIGPGVRCADVFNAMLAVVQKKIPNFKRGHFGHSLGCLRGEEYPFIAPTNPGTFEPGMVFCLEAPYYSSKNGSYNVEDSMLITENGYELFSHANRDLFWR